MLPQLVYVRNEATSPTSIRPLFKEDYSSIQSESTEQLEAYLEELLPVHSIDSVGLCADPDTDIVATFAARAEVLGLLGLGALVVGELPAPQEEVEGEVEEKTEEGEEPVQHSEVAIKDYGVNKVCKSNMRKYNLIYSKDGSEKAPGFTPCRDFVELRGNKPYYAPIGWRRWAIDLGLNGKQFQKKYGDWPVLYHGTKKTAVHKILTDGFLPSAGKISDAFLTKDEEGVYLSPSIEYSGNPRYAKPFQQGHQWVQVELQVINFNCIYND